VISVGGNEVGKLQASRTVSPARWRIRAGRSPPASRWMRSESDACRDVGEIRRGSCSGRIHVESGEVDAPLLAEGEMIADVRRAPACPARFAQHTPLGAQREAVRRIVVRWRCRASSPCASSIRAKVESPRWLILSIGSICTAICKFHRPPSPTRGKRFGTHNETLTS